MFGLLRLRDAWPSKRGGWIVVISTMGIVLPPRKGNVFHIAEIPEKDPT